MLIEDEFEVPAPLEQTWEYMQDVPRIAPCMPGADLNEMVTEDHFKGLMKTSLGPVTLTFEGSAEIVERDEAAKKVVIKAAGSEAKGKGQASMNVTATMQSSGSGTRVHVSQDLQLSGAAAQYGRGMIGDVAGVLLRQFADCVSEDIGRAQRGEAPREQRAAAPVKGFSLGLQYAVMTVKRFFQRLFGTNFRDYEEPRDRPLERQR